MIKNMRMAMKMAFGFGSIILLVGIAVAFILVNVNQIRVDAEALNHEYVPEVRVANQIERDSLQTMYAMRGYSLSFNDTFWQQAQDNLDEVFADIEIAEELAGRAVYLQKLGSGIATARSRAEEYRSLADDTRRAIEEIEATRLILDEAAAEFLMHCADFLDGQDEKMEREIGAGASAAALRQRHRKITLINDIIDAGNGIRVNNFKAQLQSDTELLRKGVEAFDGINESMMEIRPITFEAADIQELNDIQAAADTYRRGMETVLKNYQVLNQLNLDRGAVADQVLKAAEEISLAGLNQTSERTNESLDLVNLTFLVVALGVTLVVIFSLIIAIFLTRMITRALSAGVVFAQQIARGNLDISLDIHQQDEIGQLADAMRGMLTSLQYKAEMVDKFAAGDFSIRVELASEVDGLGRSMETMRNSLNDLLGQVNTAVSQVNSGSEQVSQASQSLSQGATEQASSLEEISSSVTEINGQSQQNAKNALEANALAKQATENAENGNREMRGLVSAMGEINTSSEEIKKIVKVIDDIAFQINLLALNANVEAARAGKYGRGFAVVAEEVRNLAVRSAEAVKETTERVDESVRSIESGNQAAETTAKQLEDILGGVGKVATFLEEIAQASKEQAQAISQVTEGLDQIDQVTQANTASAEESASASEELASQAQHLQQMVAQFILEQRTMRQLSAPAGYQPRPAANSPRPQSKPQASYTSQRPVSEPEETGITPVDPAEVIKLDDDDFDRF